MAKGKKIMHAFSVRDYTDREGNDRSFWSRIGTAFENRDGSFSIELDALPVNGRVVVREPSEKDGKDGRK